MNTVKTNNVNPIPGAFVGPVGGSENDFGFLFFLEPFRVLPVRAVS